MLNMTDLQIKRIIGTDYESNCYIIFNRKNKKSVLIDPNDYMQIKQYCEEQQLNNEYIFLTHEHYDHVAALCSVKKNIGGIIIASESCDRELDNVQSLLNRTYRLHMHFTSNNKSEIPYFESIKTDKTFKDSFKVKWNGCEIILKETIGHSQGSISIYFIGEMIFSGDAFLNGKPIVTKMLGGNKRDYLNSTLTYYKSLPQHIKVYPGHGEAFFLKDKMNF